MIMENNLKNLRDELIRKQSLQQESIKAANNAINEIKIVLDTLKQMDSMPVIIAKYPEMQRVLNLDIDSIKEDKTAVETMQATIESLINGMQSDLEGILNV